MLSVVVAVEVLLALVLCRQVMPTQLGLAVWAGLPVICVLSAAHWRGETARLASGAFVDSVHLPRASCLRLKRKQSHGAFEVVIRRIQIRMVESCTRSCGEKTVTSLTHGWKNE